MKRLIYFSVALSCAYVAAAPPYYWTGWEEPRIINPSDPSTFSSMEVGTGGRMAYGDTYAFPYVFVVRFTDGLSVLL